MEPTLNPVSSKTMRRSVFTWFTRSVTTLALLGFMISSLAVPVAANAQVTIVGDVKRDAGQIVLDILGGVVRNALNSVLGKIAYDTAVYVAAGDKGQESLAFNKGAEGYLADVGDSAVGAAVEGFAQGAGLEAAGLCDPGDLFRVNLGIGLGDLAAEGGKQPYQPACTLTKLKNNWSSVFEDPQFSDFVQLQFTPAANGLGISLEAENEVLKQITSKVNTAAIEQVQGDFKDATEKISGYITTPGSVIEDQLSQANAATQRTFDTVGKPFTDAISIFSSTLVQQLMKRIQQGIIPGGNAGDLAGLLGGGGAARGRAVAEARFAELRQPKFASTGTFNILGELGACPNEESQRTVNNCAIGSILSQAIIEGWTVREFAEALPDGGNAYKVGDSSLDSGQITGDGGLTPRAIIILKKYRILPVGWQLASDYIASSSTTEQLSLKSLLDQYDDCGTGTAEDPYSPFCKLIDPNWVLKAPQNFCSREAPGTDLAAQADSIDKDGNPETQEELLLIRQNYCADTRGCIAEDRSGNCIAYGYCTEEKPIYRFDGLQCDPEFASCQTFKDSEGREVSFNKSTLNYGDCATDPGCQWYCTSTDESGAFNCASPSSTYISCSEAVANNESSVGLPNGSVDFSNRGQCFASVEATCQVTAGSGVGGANNRTCDITTLGETVTCDLGDNCGEDNPNFDAASGTCTCTYADSCTVAEGQTTCTTPKDDLDASLSDEDGAGGADSCNASYSNYSNSPVCSVTAANTGDTCFIQPGVDSCINNLGNTCTLAGGTCTSSSPSYNAESGNCGCDINDTSTCTVTNGQSFGQTGLGNKCVLGVQASDVEVQQTALFFDKNVENCDERDAGCHRYIGVNESTNLISNPYFDKIDVDRDTANDEAADRLGFCSHNGEGCYTNTDCKVDANQDADFNDAEDANGICMGWTQPDSQASAYTAGAVDTLQPELGSNFVRLRTSGSATGGLETIVDTGRDLYNRTFTVAIKGASLQADQQTCSIKAVLGDASGVQALSNVAFVDAAGNEALTYSTTWATYSATVTFPDQARYGGNSGSLLKLVIPEDPNCEISIDGVQLSETDTPITSIANYATSFVNLNNKTLQCNPDDVGCELYIPRGEEDTAGVPGIITNPDSDSCVDADGNYNYANPACSQCNGNPEDGQPDNYFVGCSFFQEVPLKSPVPVSTNEAFLDGDSRPGVMQRGGGRCNNDNAISCFEDADCGAGNSCLPQLSLIPSTATQCAPAEVGCEEYTNLDSVSQGGEGLEYYSSIKQCVRNDDPNIATYTTFEGSDQGGIEIREFTLKVDTSFDAGAPCSRLNPASQDFNAACQELDADGNGVSDADCGPDGDNVYGTDPDCRQFVDASGNVYYRYESQVVEASSECIPLRNSSDKRVYYGITSKSASCSEEFVGCREYKGTSAGSARDIIDANFKDNSTEGWNGATATSNESTLQGDYSLQLHDDNENDVNNAVISQSVSIVRGEGEEAETISLLKAGKSYVLTFWAKVNTNDDGRDTLAAWIDAPSRDYYFTTSGPVRSGATPGEDVTITLNPRNQGGWQRYQVGPIVINQDEALAGANPTFNLQFVSSGVGEQAYIDSIELTESSSQYLIQNSYDYCQGFEGCQQYSNRANQQVFLKSFVRLCDENVVGCAAFIDTHNSTSPYAEAFNLENEYVEDNVVVQADSAVTLVYDQANECGNNVYGCSEVGLPQVDERTGEITGYEKKYLLNRPDDYLNILCEQSQLACEAFTSDYDGTSYFKNPGDRTCQLQEYTNQQGNLVKGWFKNGTTSTTPDCPTQDPEAPPSKPLGGVCNSNSVVGDDNRVGLQCTSDANCYPSGWAVGDPAPRCISNLDEDVDVRSGRYFQYRFYEDDGITLTRRDFGWVGTCPPGDSGCSEYIDPYSPNIQEVNSNWSFEDDVRTVNNVRYTDQDTPDGYPDYWLTPYNATLAGDLFTQVDLELDGAIDFENGCDANKNVIQTNSPNYTGSFVSPYEGGAALALTNCAVGNRYRSPAVFPIKRDALYTVRAQVKVPDQAAASDAEFSVGLLYYKYDDVAGERVLVPVPPDSIDQTYVVANRATIGEGSWEADPVDGKSIWYQWQGNIGIGSNVKIPLEATHARVFVANHSQTPIYFDGVSLKENDRYYYIDYTVDGSRERQQTDSTNSCFSQDTNQNEITSDGACVAFRDVTYDAQNYSQTGVDCTPCLLTPNSDTCRAIIDSCDTNVVLKVKRDRVCSEWMSCRTASEVTDENNNVVTQCFDLGRCTSLDENGNCNKWAETISYDNLGASDVVSFASIPGDVGELDDIKNLTGYVKVGMSWENPNVSTQGYYPYGWISEVGLSGAKSFGDLVEYSDFESLYCTGDLADTKQACINNSNGESKGQCFTQALDQRLIQNPDLAITDLVFAESDTSSPFDPQVDSAKAFCPNSPDFKEYWPFGKRGRYTRTGWQALGDSQLRITQYDKSVVDCTTDDCPEVNINNVIEIAPPDSTTTFTSGAQYDLGRNIQPNSEYTLSVKGRFKDAFGGIGAESGNPSTVSLCLEYSNIRDAAGQQLDRRDCFVDGNRSADVIFLVDASNSMAGEIANVEEAVPVLAQDLLDQGVDAQFAVVAIGPGGNSQIVIQDTTSSVNNVRNALTSVRNNIHGFKMNPYAAIIATLNNSFEMRSGSWGAFAPRGTTGALTQRTNAKQVIVLLTDVDSSDGGTYTTPTEADVINALSGKNAMVSTITNAASSSSYSAIVSTSGGALSEAIDEDDYTTGNPSITQLLVDSITANTTLFQFDNTLKTYTFGPITTKNASTSENGADADQSGTVEAKLTVRVSDNSVIQLDDVSLLPTLEVNKSQPPISRTCRAFPSNDARSCDYNDPNGVSFRGWKGYCLEIDPIKPDRCITWFPLDSLAGEESIIPRQPSGYRGRVGVYHCVVSKGNQEPGYCLDAARNFGTGISCVPDNDATQNSAACGGGLCVQGTRYTLADGFDGMNSSSTPLSNQYPDNLSGAYTTKALTWDTYDPVRLGYAAFGLNFDDTNDAHNTLVRGPYGKKLALTGYGTITQIPANELLKNVHVSEIQNLIFNTGSQGRTATYGLENQPEYPYWGQMGFGFGGSAINSADLSASTESHSPYDKTESDDRFPSYASDGDGGNRGPDGCSNPTDGGFENDLNCDNFGNWDLTDLKTGSIGQESDGSYAPWKNCGIFNTGGASLNRRADGIGCRVWGLYDSDFTQAWYEKNLGNPEANPNGQDLVYNWVWSNWREVEGVTQGELNSDCGVDNNQRIPLQQLGAIQGTPKWWFASDCFEPNFRAVMGVNRETTQTVTDGQVVEPQIFNDNIAKWEESNAPRNPWKNLGTSVCSNLRNDDGTFKAPTSDAEQVCVFNSSQLPDWDGWHTAFDSAIAGETGWGGGNIMSLYLDVNEEGYVQAVYLLTYYGADGTMNRVDSLLVPSDAPDPGLVGPVFSTVGQGSKDGVKLTAANEMSLSLQVAESCMVVAESVDQNGANTAWASRATSGGYEMLYDTSSAYGLDDNAKPYGAITAFEAGATPEVWDSVPTDTKKFSSFGKQPVASYKADSTKTANAGIPMSCIGKCDTTYCVGNAKARGVSCTSDSQCNIGGVQGICAGVGKPEVSLKGNATSFASRADQISAVAFNGKERLKYIFANIDNFYTFAGNSGYSSDPAKVGSQNYWAVLPGIVNNTIFQNMVKCPDNGTNRPAPGVSVGLINEYCGVVPRVDAISVDNNITVDGGKYTILDGATVQLRFTSIVDEQQTPLANIYIDWGDGTKATSDSWEAAPTQHLYSHAYNCTPDKQDANGKCTFTPTITISDNWKWCSGASTTAESPISGTRNRSSVAAEGQTNNLKAICGTYDAPPFTIEVDASQ